MWFHSSKDLIRTSIDTDSWRAVELGGVGKDHNVTLLEALQDFNCCNRAPAQLYLNLRRPGTIRIKLENPNGRMLLSVHRTVNIQDVLELLQLDRAVYAQIRDRTLW